jgi:DNA-binding response OmpR family regulator
MAQEKDQLGGLLAGADAYLLKPVEPPDLVAAIDRAIALSEEERLQRLKNLAEQDEPSS